MTGTNHYEKMARQPYIPLYIGDWEQDVNGLSIEAEGAWLKIIFKCWRNEGDFTATPEIMARVCKVDCSRFASILLEWKMNNICDVIEHENGLITLTSRRMKNDLAKSAVKAIAGSKGGKSAQAKLKQKNISAKAKHEYDNDNDNEVENERKEGVQGKENVPRATVEDILSEESLASIFDDIFLDILRKNYSHLDVDEELRLFKVKVRGSPEEYQHRDRSGIRLAFQYQLKTSKGSKGTLTNGKQTDKGTNHVASLVEGFKRRYGKPAS